MLFVIENILISKEFSNQKKLKIKKALIFSAGGLGNLCLYKHIINKVLEDGEKLYKFPIVDHPHISIGKINVNSLSRLNRFKDVEDCIMIDGKTNKYAFQVSPIYLGDKFFRR